MGDNHDKEGNAQLLAEAISNMTAVEIIDLGSSSIYNHSMSDKIVESFVANQAKNPALSKLELLYFVGNRKGDYFSDAAKAQIDALKAKYIEIKHNSVCAEVEDSDEANSD